MTTAPPDSPAPDSPAALHLQRDLADGDVLAGADGGRWRVVDLTEEALLVEIRVGEGDRYLGLRINYTDYPAQAPAGALWDISGDELLAPGKWPVGPLADGVFRKDWSLANGGAPYAPWDRTAIAGHTDWPTLHPGKIWHPGRTIAHYLRETWRVLEDASWPDEEQAA